MLWITRANLSNAQKTIMAKLDEISQHETKIDTKIENLVDAWDKQHKTIDSKMGYVMPTVTLLAVRFWLPIYQWE